MVVEVNVKAMIVVEVVAVKRTVDVKLRDAIFSLI